MPRHLLVAPVRLADGTGNGAPNPIALESVAGRIARSVELFSASWSVLREDKQLVVFPIVSGIAGLAVVAIFAVPVLALFVTVTTTQDITGATHGQVTMHPLGWLVTAVGYFVAMYVGTFMNAALIVAANERLTGTGPGTVASGLSGAWAKAGAFVGWVLLATTVGLALRALEERLGLVGRIVIGLIGIAWSLMTFLVVPVLVLEENSTGRAVARSVALFRQTWGENVIGNAGFGVFTFVLIVSAFVMFLIGAMVGSAVGLVVMGVLAVVWLVIGSQVIAAMSGIYRVALYRYAVDGQAPQAYAAFDFYGAFRPKKSSGLFGAPRTRTVYRSSNPSGVQVPLGQPHRDPWKAWEPPAEDPIQGEFGVEIPGADTLPEHMRPPRRTGPPPPFFGTGERDRSGPAQRPDPSDWPSS